MCEFIFQNKIPYTDIYMLKIYIWLKSVVFVNYIQTVIYTHLFWIKKFKIDRVPMKSAFGLYI